MEKQDYIPNAEMVANSSEDRLEEARLLLEWARGISEHRLGWEVWSSRYEQEHMLKNYVSRQ